MDNTDVPLVSLQVLVHAQVTATLAFSRLELQHLEQTLVATCGEVASFLVPANNIEGCVVGHTNLLHTKRRGTLRGHILLRFLTFLLRYANIPF